MCPAPIIALKPCFSFIHLVSMPTDGFRSYYLSILIQILYRGSWRYNIMIRFEAEFDLLSPLV